MGVQDVKIRNIANDLTTGIGGHLIKDVIDNSHKVLVKKENCSIWTLILVVQDATANQSGMFIIGKKPTNVSSKNHLVHVLLGNILPTIPLPGAPNATASKTLSMIQQKVPVLSNLPGDPVQMVN